MNNPRKFEDVLDECLERLLVKNETIEQCLQSFPQYANELKPLLETVLAARQASAVQPRPEFRDRARYQFKEALLHTDIPKSRVAPHFHWGWQPRWATAVAILVILSLVGSGTVAAAAGSMPDSPLYPVKKATEQVQLTLTFSELGKAELQNKLADKRVSEIAYLTEKGETEKIAELAESLNTHLSAMTALVSPPGAVSSLMFAPLAERAAAPTRPTTPATPTTPAAPTAPAQPTVPAPTAVPMPPPPAPTPPAAFGVESAQKEAAEKEVQAFQAAKESKPAEDVKVESKKETGEERSKNGRRAKLKTTVEDRAKENIARLRALLEMAPESAKPALKRALEAAEREYKKAVEALEDKDD